MRILALLLFQVVAFSQAINNPGSPTNNPNQINVTTTYLYLNKMRYAGTWSSLVTYSSQDVVTYSGSTYVSLQASNLNISPIGNPLWWTLLGGGTTSGTAGGDLTGTYPNPTVAKINGVAVPSNGYVPFNGSGQVVVGTTSIDPSTGIVTPKIDSGDGTAAGENQMYELLANGTNYISLKAPDNIPATYRLQLPASAPTAGQTLSFGAPDGTTKIASGSWGTSSQTWPSGEMFWPFGPPIWSGGNFPNFPASVYACKIVPYENITFNAYYFWTSVAATATTGFAIGIYDSSLHLLSNSSAVAYYGSGTSSDLNSTGVKYMSAAAAQTLSANTVYYLAWGQDSSASFQPASYTNGSLMMPMENANSHADCGTVASALTGTGSGVTLPATLSSPSTLPGGNYNHVTIIGVR